VALLPSLGWRECLEDAHHWIGESGRHILAIEAVARVERDDRAIRVARTPHVDVSTRRPDDPDKACSAGEIEARFGGHLIRLLVGRDHLHGEVGGKY